MSQPHDPPSPYLLSPGPDRRALMRRTGIRPCPLDYTDDELEAINGAASAPPGPTSTIVPDELAI